MFRRAQPIVFAAFLVAIPSVARAQVVLQPTPPPLVTAESAPWFLAGDPVDVNGDLYYSAGAAQAFNRYHMVRSGSFKGIPLYIDETLEPNSIVFVPLAGERVQPYERPRTGVLAGTAGSIASSFPTGVDVQATPPEGLNQALAAPAQAPAYEALGAPALIATEVTPPALAQPTVVGTSGRTAPTPPSRVTTLRPPTGLNAMWIEYDGRRWVSAGKAVDYDAARLTEVGSYRGFSVYTRDGQSSTIYIPAAPGKLAPYRSR
jgi:hypothetical protein